MPIGRSREERKWFRGWYDVVIRTAVLECGYEPVLSVAEEQPGAINDEIRSHLAFDPMVVVDLGGMSPEDPPTPNVMYELGIRHAFGLPLVIMAWEDQVLPFDVGNQRAIMSQRGFSDIEAVKKALVKFISAAEDGRFYNPMETVGREAALDATSLVLGEDSALAALISEVKELRGSISSNSWAVRTAQVKKKRIPTIKAALNKAMRSELWKVAEAQGYDHLRWARFLAIQVDAVTLAEAKGWDLEQWKTFLGEKEGDTILSLVRRSKRALPKEFVDLVDELLPEQPWPTGSHRDIGEKLEVPVSSVSRAIKELIDSGRRFNQLDGVIYKNEADYLSALEEKREEGHEDRM